MNKGKIAQPGEGVNFGEGQWMKGEPAEVEHVLPADPLIYIAKMPRDWIDAGIADKWEDGSVSFVGPLIELNRKLKSAGLGPLEPLDNDKPTQGRQYKRGSDHPNAKLLTHASKTMCIKDWANYLGLHPASLHERLRTHPVEIALSTPKRRVEPYHTKKLTYNGETKTWAAWANGLGIKVSSFRSRMRRHPNDMQKVFAPAQLSKGWKRDD